MTEQEILAALQESTAVGFLTDHGDGTFSMSAAGRAFVEQIMIPDITDRAEIFALGRMQGLSEATKVDGKIELTENENRVLAGLAHAQDRGESPNDEQLSQLTGLPLDEVKRATTYLMQVGYITR